MKVSPLVIFSREASARWAKLNLRPGTDDVRSDGPGRFPDVIDAECAHSYVVVAAGKPREWSQFTWEAHPGQA